MTRAGSIIGISVVIDINAWTQGDLTLTAKIAGVAKLVATLVLSGTGNGQTASATASSGTHTFVAGQVISVARALTNTPVGITTDDMTVMVEVDFDS